MSGCWLALLVENSSVPRRGPRSTCSPCFVIHNVTVSKLRLCLPICLPRLQHYCTDEKWLPMPLALFLTWPHIIVRYVTEVPECLGSFLAWFKGIANKKAEKKQKTRSRATRMSFTDCSSTRTKQFSYCTPMIYPVDGETTIQNCIMLKKYVQGTDWPVALLCVALRNQ